jgi:hypothetical protein
MGKLSIIAEPTFFAEVPIPVAGKGDVPIKFEFKHRTRDQLDAWLKAREDRSYLQAMMDMVKGWDFDDEFNEANVSTLLQSYIGTARAVANTYLDQLIKARSGN